MNCSGELMSLAYESADSQPRLTAKISTARVATRNSGTATIARVTKLRQLSMRPPRPIAEPIPSTSATGTETSAVAPASIKVLGTRPAISSPTGMALETDTPMSPVSRLINQCR